MEKAHPIFSPERRSHSSQAFAREEVRLANRNSGILLEALRHDITPLGLHYLLTHFDLPYVAHAEDWRLEIAGSVQNPLVLALAELRQMPQTTLAVTLECAGNGRGLIEPRWPSQPWHYEAAGTAEWTGTRLGPLLERAGIEPGTAEIAFFGSDRGFDAGVEHPYGRSLPADAALNGDALLVWEMNGQPLLPQHGFPLRLIVPGWYGMASVKWLNRIECLTEPFQGFQQVGTYIYKQDESDPGAPVTQMRVRSLMVPPGIPDWYTRHRVVERGPVELFGRAWSGAGVGIAKVEVAIDGAWHEAKLDAPGGKYAWRGWRFLWDSAPGEYVLTCRATDMNGDVQPLEQRWDRAGFGNNCVQRVSVTVR